ncbi:unnamed protein product [Rotaria socialis]|uniref:Transposase n=1 Tax=Rotaria socialis TaxID=392032 RepID=A0A821TE99_9BILA|nr:unnamed protein product [Rotaria socialis]
MKRKKNVSIRKLASELDISNGSVVRILKQDLGYDSYRKRVEPTLTDYDKRKRATFPNWARHNFRKEDTLRILFSDEKTFDLDGIYSAQNDRIWAVDHDEAGACAKGLTPLIILDKGTVDHQRYINEVFSVALKYGDEVFGDN